MKIDLLPVMRREQLTSTVVALHVRSSYIANIIQPGQFVNIKVQEGTYPLLRRPFSVAAANDDVFTVIFDVVGEGTRILSEKKAGDYIDVLGPLGIPYTLPQNKEITAVLVAGGLGMAPMPILTQTLIKKGHSKILTFLGARSSEYLVDYNLQNVHFATDDNSKGFHGTVVSLVDHWLTENKELPVYIYTCGPNPMLKALQRTLSKHSVKGQLSFECVMACGIGICQGCPVESANGTQKFHLVCKEGPVFDIHSVKIP